MKYFLLLTALLVFVGYTGGTHGTRPRVSARNDLRDTNRVEVDYISATTASGDGSRVESTWMWLPDANERNEIKYASVLSIVDQSTELSSKDANDATTKIQQDRKVREDDRNMTSQKQENNVTFVSERAILKKLFNWKKQRIIEKRYLNFYKNLQENNWCFKDKQGTVGETKFKKTGECCERRKVCREAGPVKRGIYECSCDTHFYGCLERSGTKMSSRIGQLYFNRRMVVCYQKHIVQKCAKSPCYSHYKRWNIDYFPQ